MNRKKQLGKHAAFSGIRMPQTRRMRASESGILRRAALALCACLLFTTVFVGCGTEASDEPVDPSKLQVMASFYTMYDFAQKIGGEHVQVTCMVPSGTEPHDWEPSTKDITRMEPVSYRHLGIVLFRKIIRSSPVARWNWLTGGLSRTCRIIWDIFLRISVRSISGHCC